VGPIQPSQDKYPSRLSKAVILKVGNDFRSSAPQQRTFQIHHSANLKKTSRSLTINQCSGGSFLRGQYRQLLADRRSTATLDGYYVGKRVSFSDKPGPSR
jgi:hypothetical protein